MMVMVVLRGCPLRHSSLRTPNTLPLQLQLWQNAGDDNFMVLNDSKRKTKYTFYGMIWCSITRRGHIKSQYLQTVQMILVMLRGIGFPSKARNILVSWYVCCLYIQTYNRVLVVENKSESMRTLHSATSQSNH